MEGEERGVVCVTGGTGYLASWLIMKLLDEGYRVRTTIRSYPESKRDLGFLTGLPGAAERLEIFDADLRQPETFAAAVEGCSGVFHTAHPIESQFNGQEQPLDQGATTATLEILKACIGARTVRRVVYTSSASAVAFSGEDLEVVDERNWSDVEFLRNVNPLGAPYYVSKTVTERAAMEFAEKNGLELVTVIPSYINGPFIGPRLPGSVSCSLALIFGDKEQYKLLTKINMVHVDDVASAHIFLMENPRAKGRYICSSLDITMEKMSEFLSKRYPEYQIPSANYLREFEGFRYPDLSSKKLLDIGFRYRHGLEEMYDGAIQCCKKKGFLH